MSSGRARLRAAAALALAALAGGCVAVVALPAVVGGGLMVRSDHRVRAATRVPRGTPTVELKTEQARAAVLAAPAAVTVTGLTELPPPDRGVSGAPGNAWAPFVTYALAQAQAKPPQSALLASGSRLEAPVRRACPSPTPAVILDLDDGAAPFAPATAAKPDPALAEGLARLRQAGVVVLWITRLPAARAADVAGWVRSSGLDPEAQDQFLLVRNPDDRKQVLREQANRDVCVVAIAGSARGDFDELYDYLRDPSLALGLEPMIGAGWFLVPPFDAVSAPATPAPVSAPPPAPEPPAAPVTAP